MQASDSRRQVHTHALVWLFVSTRVLGMDGPEGCGDCGEKPTNNGDRNTHGPAARHAHSPPWTRLNSAPAPKPAKRCPAPSRCLIFCGFVGFFSFLRFCVFSFFRFSSFRRPARACAETRARSVTAEPSEFGWVGAAQHCDESAIALFCALSRFCLLLQPASGDGGGCQTSQTELPPTATPHSHAQPSSAFCTLQILDIQ